MEKGTKKQLLQLKLDPTGNFNWNNWQASPSHMARDGEEGD
jgi:hypothetical protein